jgi:hypothetical protein
MEESVYDSACMKQVVNGAKGTEIVIGFRLGQRIPRAKLKVGPFLGYE